LTQVLHLEMGILYFWPAVYKRLTRLDPGTFWPDPKIFFFLTGKKLNFFIFRINFPNLNPNQRWLNRPSPCNKNLTQPGSKFFDPDHHWLHLKNHWSWKKNFIKQHLKSMLKYSLTLNFMFVPAIMGEMHYFLIKAVWFSESRHSKLTKRGQNMVACFLFPIQSHNHLVMETPPYK